MNVQRWIARREPNWQRLDALLKKAERQGLKSLRSDQIQLLASLYRSVSADLARARTHPVGDTLVKDLQLLTTRSYSQIYQGSRRQEWRAAVDFYLWGLPALIRQSAGYIALATGIFLLGALVAWWLAWRDPAFLSVLVPQSLITQVRDQRQLWMGSIVGYEPLASGYIMVNNLIVCFRAIAGGIAAGVLTGIALLFNGLFFGAVATLVGQNNLAYPFWAFVFPHGSLELPAIFFSGGAGLLIARGLVFPGQYRRGDALRLYGAQAAQLVCAVVPMLVVAGIIEGFLSPSPLVPSPLKYLVGLVLFVLLVLYCLRTPAPAA